MTSKHERDLLLSNFLNSPTVVQDAAALASSVARHRPQRAAAAAAASLTHHNNNNVCAPPAAPEPVAPAPPTSRRSTKRKEPCSSSSSAALSADAARKEKRRRQNRIAARNSRGRKKAYVADLERKVKLLTSQVESLRQENTELHTRLATHTATSIIANERNTVPPVVPPPSLVDSVAPPLSSAQPTCFRESAAFAHSQQPRASRDSHSSKTKRQNLAVPLAPTPEDPIVVPSRDSAPWMALVLCLHITSFLQQLFRQHPQHGRRVLSNTKETRDSRPSLTSTPLRSPSTSSAASTDSFAIRSCSPWGLPPSQQRQQQQQPQPQPPQRAPAAPPHGSTAPGRASGPTSPSPDPQSLPSRDPPSWRHRRSPRWPHTGGPLGAPRRAPGTTCSSPPSASPSPCSSALPGARRADGQAAARGAPPRPRSRPLVYSSSVVKVLTALVAQAYASGLGPSAAALLSRRSDPVPRPSLQST